MPKNDIHQHPKLLVNAYPHDLEECLSEELVQFSALLRLQDDNFSSTDYKEIKKLVRDLLGRSKNHLITWVEFIQSGRGVCWLTMGIILSRIFLLIFPISDLDGLISLIVGLFWNSGL